MQPPSCPRGLAALALVCLTGLALLACGGGNGASGGADAAEGTAIGDAALEKRLAADYAGTFGTPPERSPAPTKDKVVAIVPLTQLSPTFAAVSAEAEQAAKAAGWRPIVIDGDLTPTGWNQAVRQATAQNVDAIVVGAIPCAPVRGSLEAAKAAGIKVYGVYGDDCDPPVFDAAQAVDTRVTARMRADWMVAKAGPEAEIVLLNQTDDPGVARLTRDTERALGEICPGCEVHRVDFGFGDLGERLKGKIQTALLRYPNADVFAFPYDAAILLGGGAAIAGAPPELAVFGGECSAPTLPLIRNGTLDACVGLPFATYGWAAIDGVNRIFAGEKAVDAGVGVQLVDKDHNLPAAGDSYVGPEPGFRAQYERMWAAGGE